MEGGGVSSGARPSAWRAPRLFTSSAWGAATALVVLLVHGCESHPACVTSQDCDTGETCVYYVSDGCGGTGKCLDNCDVGSGGAPPPKATCGCVGVVGRLPCWGGNAVAGPAADLSDVSCFANAGEARPCTSGAAPDPSCPAAMPFLFACSRPFRRAGDCVPASQSGSSCCQNPLPCGVPEFEAGVGAGQCPSNAPYGYTCPPGVSPPSSAGACVTVGAFTCCPD
jgi:hypothetical protein